ncbi:thiol peroxidase [Microvirgula curvata]|uniref:thiol peroxidase n=1 Tax=Microvirgula TaxID=57479 RepID=UPI000DC57DB4|nr:MULTISPECIES: thiol peroxidase [Microvirgula]RAS19851.1 peroxiredoxin [Microvirgula sp. AG722]
MNLNLLYCRSDTVHVAGDLPQAGMQLPGFMLVNEHFNDISLESFRDRIKVIMTVLSVELEDSARLVDELVASSVPAASAPALVAPVLIVVSADTPLTLKRVAAQRGWHGVVLLSTLRGRDFHRDYGVMVVEHPFAGLTAPAVLVADPFDVVQYSARLPDTGGSFDWSEVALALEAQPEWMTQMTLR